ncbi:flavin reductase family protein [Saccharospirillum impatiens]|uniref:flavin reductase family protein n=1 Tax=Saccharospirillum impatiens TaxID=169438 RepID=UPI00041B24E4|nr:flavin reductase family protein [Saccharospirillum impatiens]
MELAIADLDATAIYKLMVGSIQPRPIAWVCTRNHQGVLNLAPFSFFTLVSVNPPIVAFAPLRKPDGSEKDTVLNLQECPEFTLNIVSHRVVEAMNKTSAPLARGDSEVGFAGLSTTPSLAVLPPRIAQAQIHFECRLRDLQRFGDEPMAGRLVLGDIIQVHVADELYDQGRIRTEKLDAVGRMAGNTYSTTRDTFDIDRPG